jgi:DNA-binding transcriptional MerR regulator
MKMAELSERSGVPIPTIRYYLREGLLPPGEHTSPNQARYDTAHLRRLTLIRAMVEVGEMPIAAVKAMFEHLDASSADELTTLGLVQYTLVRHRGGSGASDAASLADVQALIDDLEWRVRPTHPARPLLGATMQRLHALDQGDVLELLDHYAAVAHELAELEVAITLRREGLDARVEAIVMIGGLGDTMLACLRKMAQEDVMTRAFSPGPPAQPAQHR